MTLYDKLTINKFINGSFKEFKDMNLDIAMEDMIRYIEKMGGVVNETPSDYTIFSPILWTGKIYQRITRHKRTHTWPLWGSPIPCSGSKIRGRVTSSSFLTSLTKR